MNYKIFSEYGKNGKNLNEFIIYFNPEETELDQKVYEMFEKEWKRKIEEAKEKGKVLHNDSLLNFDGAKDFEDVNVILTSPTRFSYYITTRDLLNGRINLESYNFRKEIIEALEEKINPLSSFSAILIEDYFLMGTKGKQVEKASGALSFPEAGYLNVEKDTIEIEGKRIAKHPTNIVEREIKEELGIVSDEIKRIKAIAIAKDCYKGSHWNTALFSVVEADLKESEIASKWGFAKDSWEHERLILVPKEKKCIEALINSDLNKEEISYSIRKEIKGNIPRKISLTGKSRLMLFYLGRFFEGEEFEEKIEEYKLTFRV